MRLGKDGKVKLIQKVPLFSRLSKKGLEEVARIADELDLPSGLRLPLPQLAQVHLSRRLAS